MTSEKSLVDDSNIGEEALPPPPTAKPPTPKAAPPPPVAPDDTGSGGGGSGGGGGNGAAEGTGQGEAAPEPQHAPVLFRPAPAPPPVDVLDIELPKMRGWLRKEGHNKFKTWKRRYFVRVACDRAWLCYALCSRRYRRVSCTAGLPPARWCATRGKLWLP